MQIFCFTMIITYYSVACHAWKNSDIKAVLNVNKKVYI